jgi:hypothetical protein
MANVRRRLEARPGAREHLIAFGVLAAIALFYLWPVLVGGRVLLPNELLDSLPPWAAAPPKGFSHGLNPLLSDIPGAYYPWNVFARRMIDGGSLPVWNPYAFSGTPFYANAQSALLSPFSLPMWIFSLGYGLGVAAWLKLVVAGFGTYRLVRRLRLGFWPGLLAAIGYMLCAFNVLWLEYETLPAVAAMFPWALLLCERIATADGARARDLVGLAVITLIGILAGQPEIAVHVMAGSALYLVLRSLTVPGTPGARARRIAFGAAGLALGVLLSAAVFLPVLKAGLGTPGSDYRTGGGVALSWSALRTELFPGWWNPLVLGLGPTDYLERTFYTGAVTVLLAVAAAFTRDRARDKLPLTVLAVLGILISFHTPGLFWLATHTPGLDHTQLARLLIWAQLALPVLAAFGLQQLLDAPRRQRAVWIAIGAAVVAAVVATISLGPSVHDLRTALNHFRTGRDYTTTAVISLVSVGWWLIFVTAAGAALILARRLGRPRLGAALLTLCLLADLLHFGSGFNPMQPASVAVLARTPAVAFLQQHAAGGRVLGDGYTLVNDYDSVYGLRDVRGYDPPQPSRRYFDLWRTAHSAQLVWASYSVVGTSPAVVHLMDVLGARWYVTGPGGPARAGTLQRVYSGADATIYENPGAAPPVLVADRILVTAGEPQTLSAIDRPGFDPRREVIAERDQPDVTALPTAGSGGSARIISSTNATVTLQAQTRERSVVVLNDAAAPGWSVTVDGHPRPALRVDDVMRGVIVPAGTHQVRWHYTVPGLKLGLLISALSALGLLGAALALTRARARPRSWSGA